MGINVKESNRVWDTMDNVGAVVYPSLTLLFVMSAFRDEIAMVMPCFDNISTSKMLALGLGAGLTSLWLDKKYGVKA